MEAVKKAAKALWKTVPMILGTVLLVSLISVVIPKSFYSSIFSGNLALDSIVGSVIGSISAGNPVSSYILGGEFIDQGVSLVAVLAFMVSWVTVGLVQLPAEGAMLGKRFTVLRNVSALVLSIFVAVVTTLIYGVLV